MSIEVISAAVTGAQTSAGVIKSSEIQEALS